MTGIPASPAESAPALLAAFGHALDAERAALVDLDAEALANASRDKLDSLQALISAIGAEPALADRYAAQLRDLAARNVANGALLTQRRRDVLWTLRRLGLVEPDAAYGCSGQLAGTGRVRSLAQA